MRFELNGTKWTSEPVPDTSPHCHETFEAVLAGASDPKIEGVEVVRRPALTVSPVDMLEADGYLLGTPANLGYISVAVKHAFDVCYYPCLDSTRGRPSASTSTDTRAPRGRAGRRCHHERARLGESRRNRRGAGQTEQG